MCVSGQTYAVTSISDGSGKRAGLGWAVLSGRQPSTVYHLDSAFAYMTTRQPHPRAYPFITHCHSGRHNSDVRVLRVKSRASPPQPCSSALLPVIYGGFQPWRELTVTLIFLRFPPFTAKVMSKGAPPSFLHSSSSTLTPTRPHESSRLHIELLTLP